MNSAETDGIPIRDALTFDDVLLVPAASQVLPRDVNVKTRLTREITLSLPFVSAAMDTVTEHETAICMAQNGGLGVVHRNLPPEVQAAEVARVKRFESGLIVDPITMRPEQRIGEARQIMAKNRISGVPVTKDGKAVGILTNRDLRFVRNDDQPISNVMTPREKLVAVAPGTELGALQGAAPRTPHRKAARGRRPGRSARAAHDQGHREERAFPARRKGRVRSPALRRRRGRRARSIATRAGARRRQRRRDRRRYRARPFAAGAGHAGRTPAPVPDTPDGRRQRCHRARAPRR